MLAAHEAAEESVIYPVLKLNSDGSKVVATMTDEENAAKEVLSDLLAMDASSAEFETAFADFMADVLKHASEEESDVLPLLRSSCTTQDREAMGADFVAATKRAAS